MTLTETPLSNYERAVLVTLNDNRMSARARMIAALIAALMAEDKK